MRVTRGKNKRKIRNKSKNVRWGGVGSDQIYNLANLDKAYIRSPANYAKLSNKGKITVKKYNDYKPLRTPEFISFKNNNVNPNNKRVTLGDQLINTPDNRITDGLGTLDEDHEDFKHTTPRIKQIIEGPKIKMKQIIDNIETYKSDDYTPTQSNNAEEGDSEEGDSEEYDPPPDYDSEEYYPPPDYDDESYKGGKRKTSAVKPRKNRRNRKTKKRRTKRY